MGNRPSQIQSQRISRVNVVFLGKEGAGKSSLLHHLKQFEVSTIPTISHNFEDLYVEGHEVKWTSIYGRGRLRVIYRYMFSGTHGFVFVIDSTREKELLNEEVETFDRLASRTNVGDAIFMVVANKQDLPGAVPAQEIEDDIKERNLFRNRVVLVVPCNALDVKQVHRIFTIFIHLLCLNTERGWRRDLWGIDLVTMREQKEIEDKITETTMKHPKTVKEQKGREDTVKKSTFKSLQKTNLFECLKSFF